MQCDHRRREGQLGCKTLGGRHGHAQLPIGLTVELVGAHKDDPTLARGAQQHEVGRDALVSAHAYHIAHAQVLGRHGH